jgi:methoxymalonate biosynthesis protein
VIKCVVWDIDNTLLDGVYLESADQPPAPDPVLIGVLRDLAGRGIVHALASKNPPEAADYLRRVTGASFAAAECGWNAKADAIARIAAKLDLAQDAMAFIDDDMLERAEVAAAMPDVLVLSPEEASEAASWPQFSPAVITAEARRRGEMYDERRRRQAAASAFGGTREQFLRHAGTRIGISPATTANLARLHELSVRTHQLNSAGVPVGEREFGELIGSAGHQVVTVSLADDFGDDGLVGAAVADCRASGRWSVPIVMVSCRALGRGALDALLAWLCRAAARAGAAELRVPCLVTERNVPMRLALAAAGLRAEPGAVGSDGRAIFGRSLAGELPALPDWASASQAP